MRSVTAAACSLALGACHDRPLEQDAGSGSVVDASMPRASSPDAAAASRVRADAAVGAAADVIAVADGGAALRSSLLDGGTSSCKRIYGPAQQPFDGPAALVVRGERLELVTNDRGRPQVVAVPIPASTRAVVAPPPAPPPRLHDTVHPPCAVAGETVFCVGPGNILTRFPHDGPPKEVATVISVRGIAAAPLGPLHDVVAFHQQRKTSEGFVSEGWVSLDGQTPERLSEEGSGATAIDLAVAPGAPGASGASGAPSAPGAAPDVLALSLDARVAMTPMHARHIGLATNPSGSGPARLALGTDEVVFIGPFAEPGTVPRLGTTHTAAYALTAWPREAADFGLSVVALPSALRIDLPAVWSLYRNGLDPAPVAATHGSEGRAPEGAPVAVVRVVPAIADRHGDLVLELGTLASDGAFVSAGEITRGRTLSDVSITRDDRGALWILWSDADSTWLERRICP